MAWMFCSLAWRHAPSGPTATNPMVVTSPESPPPVVAPSADSSPSPLPQAPSASAATMAADVARIRRDLFVLILCSFAVDRHPGRLRPAVGELASARSEERRVGEGW